MSCIDSGFLSPGYLRLDYVHSSQSIPHSTRARLIFGVDPLDVGLMESTADDWAGWWAGVVPASFTCSSYSVLRHDGSLLYSGTLPGSQIGVHPSAAGSGDYASRTLCFTGRGLPAALSECSGEAIGRLFVGSGYEFVARQRFMVNGVDAGVDNYAQFLRLNTVVWADEFGNKANVRGRYPVQFNAYAQGRNGT
jgi:hypothetical protein